MSGLIKFPSSYVFVAGYDVYNSFMTKHISSLPINGNNIAYTSTEKDLTETITPKLVIDYYKKNIEKFSKEPAKITVLDSPLLNSLAQFVYRYRRHKHISEKDFTMLFNKSLELIENSIDMSTVYYIYLRYYPYSATTFGTFMDSIISSILRNYKMFHFNSIYSRQEEHRVKRFDDLLTHRLKNVADTDKFNKIINKDA